MIERIDSALSRGRESDTLWDNGRETPEWAFASAIILQEITGIPVIRVRGRPIDILVCAKGVEVSNPAMVRNSLLISRDLGTLKVANPTGLIDEPHEVGALRNAPFGYYLAAQRKVSDLIDCSYRLAGLVNSEQNLKTNCFAALPDGRMIFAVPPCPFFERAGGTQSAGDTMDITFSTEQSAGVLAAAHAKSLHDAEQDALRKAA